MIQSLLNAQIKELVNKITSLHGASNTVQRDVDGAPINVNTLVDSIIGGSSADGDDDDNDSLDELRTECWRSYDSSPFVQTAVGDFVDAIIGDGFEITSGKPRIRNLINLYETDFRNKLYLRYKQFLMHYRIEGEKYISFTVHPKKNNQPFIEIDHIDPATIEKIYFHPNKTHLPLLYKIKRKMRAGDKKGEKIYIPSINMAYQPTLIDQLSEDMGKDGFEETDISGRSNSPEFEKVGGYTQFISDWEGETIKSRPKSRLRTIIVWNNLYTLMKLTEVEHKRALSTFVWVTKTTTQEAFDTLVAISQDKELSKTTGIFGKKTSGSHIFLPPNSDLVASTPKLPEISGQDSDLLQGAVAGLNQPSHDITGDTSGTFTLAKATRPAVVERVKHVQDWSEKLYRYEFWKPILFLQNAVYGFPLTFTEYECVDHRNQEEIWKNVKYNAWDLLTFTFPLNENYDFSSNADYVLGREHWGVGTSFGVSAKTAGARIGIRDIAGERRRKATEDAKYPELKQPMKYPEKEITDNGEKE